MLTRICIRKLAGLAILENATDTCHSHATKKENSFDKFFTDDGAFHPMWKFGVPRGGMFFFIYLETPNYIHEKKEITDALS